jgi:hypothetical protein
MLASFEVPPPAKAIKDCARAVAIGVSMKPTADRAYVANGGQNVVS